MPKGFPNYLLDNDLSPDIAKALRSFGFNIQHYNEIPQFQNRPDGASDPEIIAWCKDNKSVWITHDFAARRKHQDAMKLAKIHVIWVRGKTEEIIDPTQPSATWRFFKTIVRTIDETQRLIIASHGAIHFKLSQKVGSRPEIDWAESPYDRHK